jgi:ABC-type branched-subunit amino acid transport system ATPase component
MSGAGAPFFRAEGLHKSFGGVRAVQAISLAVPEGAIVAVIGPNGAGKSTLINLLSGIHQPDSGCVLLDGRDLVGVPAWRRARLGIARTFQKIRLFRQLSVLENVTAGFHRHHELRPWQYVLHGAAFRADRRRAEAEAMERLAFVGLADRAGDRAGALPYGQQRMLEVARALATRPRLFMLDEPAAGLNVAEVEFLTERLVGLRRHGTTILVVEHNMDLVMTAADRVLVMDHGERLSEGTPAAVQGDPAVIAAYLGAEAPAA